MSMHIQYKKLFSVETEASNNANIKPEIFKYSPTIKCHKLLGKFGLVYNTFQNGFTVYYKLDKLRPNNDQLAAEITLKQTFTFNFNLNDPSLKLQYPDSFKMTNGPQFYINNLDNVVIKPNGASLHLDTTLGDPDNILLSGVTELGSLGYYEGKRSSDAAITSFDLNSKSGSKKPFGVLEIVVSESQKTFNNIAYKIKLKAS